MKTHEEIKKALKLCQNGSCKFCPYDDDEACGRSKNGDALAYIKQLESRLAQAEKERDAAVFDLHGDCDVCKNGGKTCMKCVHCLMSQEATMDSWEWRGVCAENTEEDSDGKD